MAVPVVHILQGKYKNRKIKLPEKIHGHSEVTSQKIKESAFQIALNHIRDPHNALFVDCFCGSGQMGFEAISRQYSGVYFYDISSERISTATEWAKSSLDETDIRKCRFEKKDSLRDIFTQVTGNFNTWLDNADKISNIVFFADPPYEMPYKSRNILDLYIEQFLNLSGNFKFDVVLVFQTNKKNILKSVLRDGNIPENTEDLLFKIYEYGNNRLVVFKRSFNKD